MVIAQKMQYAVNEKSSHLLVQGHGPPVCLPLCCWDGYGDIAQKMGLNCGKGAVVQGKGNNIGGACFFEVLLIQARNARVIKQQNAYLCP